MKKNASLKKHHFWILAGLAPLLAVLAMVFMMTGPGNAKDKAAKEIQTKLETASKTNPPGKGKLEKDFPDQKAVLHERRKKLWEANYNAQKDIFAWPESPKLKDLEKRYPKFGVPMETTRNSALDDIKSRDIYEAAYDRVADEIKPTTFPGGTWKSVLRYVSNWTQKYPTSDQVWLALEDLWVQRGLLLPVKAVNAAAAKFELVTEKGPDGKPVDPPPLKRTFESRIWRLELTVPTEGQYANKAMLAKLTNKTNRIQLLGTNTKMKLNVWLSEGAPNYSMRYVIEKDFAKAHETIEVKTPVPILHTIPPGTEVQAITRVEQVLDERTVPVRQVMNVVLGKTDARHFSATLKPPDWWKEAAAAAVADPTGMGGLGGPGGEPGMMPGDPGGEGLGSPDGAAGPGPGLFGRGGPGMPGMFGGGGQQAAKTGAPLSVLNYNKNRYVQTTPQVRRMPVAVVLLVDQMFIQDALVAYANSPLRFQITQYHWQRFRGTLSSAAGGGGLGGGMGFPSFGGMEPGPGEAGSPDGGEFGSPDGGESGGGLILGRGGSGPGPGMMPGEGEGGYGGYGNMYGGGGMTGSVSEGQITSGLVELTLYGIITLYNKYEEQVADGTAPAAGTTDPTQPAATTAPSTGAAATPAAPGAGTTPAPTTGPTTQPPATPQPPAAPPTGTPPGGTAPGTPKE